MDSDSAIVPSQLMNYFDENIHLVDLSVINLAANIGYMYSFVWKEKFFITLGLIPGLNFNLGDSKADNREILKWNISYKFKTMNAFGYNSKRVYMGIQVLGDFNNLRIKKGLSTLYSNGSMKLFFGYRFIKKKRI